MRDGDHGHAVAGRPVEGAEIALERPVVRRDDGQPGQPVGVDGTDERVVVDDVEVGDSVVGRDHMTQLGRATPGADADRPLEDPSPWHRAGAIAGGVQEDLVAGPREPPGESVEDGLGAAIGGRRNLHPRRGDDGDAHVTPALCETLDPATRWWSGPGRNGLGRPLPVGSSPCSARIDRATTAVVAHPVAPCRRPVHVVEVTGPTGAGSRRTGHR